MDSATLTALKESIEKWEKRAAGDHRLGVGTITCPLCQLFHANRCQGCPVFEETEVRYCECTPFLSYLNDRTNANAQKEVDFLRSLLPAEEAEKKKENFSWVNLDYLKS